MPRRRFAVLSYQGGDEPSLEAEAGDRLPPEGPKPGDFIVTHGRALTSRLIRFGQRFQFRGDDRVYAHWNHVGLLVPDPDEGHLVIVEALGRGVVVRDLSAYQDEDFKLVHVEQAPDGLPVREEDRAQAANFALWAAGRQDANGEPITGATGAAYGFLTIASIALMLAGPMLALLFAVGAAALFLLGHTVFGWAAAAAAVAVIFLRRVAFASPGQMICSGLVARSLERVGFIFGWKPVSHVMPADLAKFFDVRREADETAQRR